MRNMRNTYKILVEKLENLMVNGRLILKYVSSELNSRDEASDSIRGDYVRFVGDKFALKQVFLRVLRIHHINHHSIIAPYSYNRHLKGAITPSRQHIITSSVPKMVASSNPDLVGCRVSMSILLMK
jgi:hypothetical protein